MIPGGGEVSDGQTIKAIETRYKGFRFRSRLEARVAVFLDALGLEWEYEKEGYDLGELGWYLPDFYMPEMDCWIEIKGKALEYGGAEWNKVRALALQSGQWVYVFCGQITTPVNYAGLSFSGYESDPECPPPAHAWWFQCPVCKQWQLGPTVHDLNCGCSQVHPSDQPALVNALARARQARFEHGERGQ